MSWLRSSPIIVPHSAPAARLLQLGALPERRSGAEGPRTISGVIVGITRRGGSGVARKRGCHTVLLAHGLPPMSTTGEIRLNDPTASMALLRPRSMDHDDHKSRAGNARSRSIERMRMGPIDLPRTPATVSRSDPSTIDSASQTVSDTRSPTMR